MNSEELKNHLSSTLPELQYPEIVSPLLNVSCTPEQLLEASDKLKHDEKLKFDFLYCQTAIDWPENVEVIYHLRSSSLNHEMVLRVKTADRENPEVPTVYKLWATAEFHEREIYDLFGVKFKDHPDLRRIFLEDDWVGYPLRKDYVDEINIVEL